MKRVRVALRNDLLEPSAYFQSGGLVDAVLKLGLPAAGIRHPLPISRVQWFIARTAKLLPQAGRPGLVLMCSLGTTMHVLVAWGTERNQVLLGVISGLAAMLLMMNLQVRPCAACLASPAIPL